MTLAQLRRHVRTWQTRLRVTDWHVSVAWGTLASIEACGTTLYDPRAMTAQMSIAQDMEDAAYEDGGIEQTVIHELLHLVIHGDREYKGEQIMQERAINQIADALYRAYRRKRKGE